MHMGTIVGTVILGGILLFLEVSIRMIKKLGNKHNPNNHKNH